MNKLPARQIYALFIIVTGIISLSIYSTYALFTLEEATDDIVSIHTPDAIDLTTDVSEYRQLTVGKNSYITTDIDLYNNYSYDLCYSVWYYTLDNSDMISVYERSENSSATGVLSAISSKRINLYIINDGDEDVRVNLGVSYTENGNVCSLNVLGNHSLVSVNIKNSEKLTDKLISNGVLEHKDGGYITYKDITGNILLNDKIEISDSFSINDEIFTLDNKITIDVNELKKYLEENIDKDYYMCYDSECRYLSHILEIEEVKIDDNIDKEKDEDVYNYYLTKFDRLMAYQEGENGLRKIDNNYVYVGDNPDNYIYFNCKSDINNETCELWRIIGFNYDDEKNEYYTRIIKDDYLEGMKYNNNSNVWDNSLVYNYLFKDYEINNKKYLLERNYKQENIISTDINIKDIEYLDKEYKSNISMMNLSDYLLASSCSYDKINMYDKKCLTNNWLNKNETEWTMSVLYEDDSIDKDTNKRIIPDNNRVYIAGNELLKETVDNINNIRPVVNLKSRILLVDGNGTRDNPFVIR